MFRVQLQLPPDADEAVVEALRAVGTSLGVAPSEVEESNDAPENTYGLTVHVLPDPKEE
jgi:hypothetical protein